MSTTGANPLAEGLRLQRRAEPCAVVIFGASGDLTQRKLLPALYALAVRRLVPEQFGIVGVARTEHTTEEGEAQRNDDAFMFVSAWEHTGDLGKPKLHKEQLVFEFVKPSARSYK